MRNAVAAPSHQITTLRASGSRANLRGSARSSGNEALKPFNGLLDATMAGSRRPVSQTSPRNSGDIGLTKRAGSVGQAQDSSKSSPADRSSASAAPAAQSASVVRASSDAGDGASASAGMPSSGTASSGQTVASGEPTSGSGAAKSRDAAASVPAETDGQPAAALAGTAQLALPAPVTQPALPRAAGVQGVSGDSGRSAADGTALSRAASEMQAAEDPLASVAGEPNDVAAAASAETASEANPDGSVEAEEPDDQDEVGKDEQDASPGSAGAGSSDMPSAPAGAASPGVPPAVSAVGMGDGDSRGDGGVRQQGGASGVAARAGSTTPAEQAGSAAGLTSSSSAARSLGLTPTPEERNVEAGAAVQTFGLSESPLSVGEGSIPLANVPATIARLSGQVTQASPKSVVLKLDPPALGSVHIRIQATGGGISVKIVAPSHETCRLLQGAAGDLHGEMSRQGIDLNSFSASVMSDGDSSRQTYYSQDGRQRSAAGLSTSGSAEGVVAVSVAARIGVEALDARV